MENIFPGGSVINMDVDRLTEIIEAARNCPHLASDEPTCGRLAGYNHPNQLFMNPAPTQQIVLISESPSTDAALNNVLNDYSNPTFRDIYRYFFLRDVANEDVFYNKRRNIQEEIYIKNNFDKFKNYFDTNWYWTHYCKCYPGKTNEKKLKDTTCATSYIWDEINAVNPKLIIVMGEWASKFLVASQHQIFSSISMTIVNEYEIISLTHISPTNGSRKKYKLMNGIAMMRNQLKRLGLLFEP